MSRAAVVVVNTNGRRDIVDCLAAIQGQSQPAGEVVVVDNISTDGSPELIRERFPDVRLVTMDRNRGYGAACNVGIRATLGDPVLVMNEDVILDRDWLEVVGAAYEADSRLGVAGSKLLYPDGVTVQHAGGLLHKPLLLADHRRYRQPDDPSETEPLDVEYVTGAAIAFRRAVLSEIGLFDEGFFVYFEETDMCQRARDAGWAVRYLPRARAIHRESANTKRDSARYYELYHYSRMRYALKHLSPAQFLGELVPAERARLGSVVAIEELVALRSAFAAHADQLAVPDGSGLAAAQPELRPALADALAQLASHAVATTPTSVHAEPQPSPLRATARVEPRPFHSPLPGVARLRSAWNWMSTRWYLAPILEQQNRLNADLVAALERIDARLERLEKREDVQASWLVELDRDLAALRRRLVAPDR